MNTEKIARALANASEAIDAAIRNLEATKRELLQAGPRLVNLPIPRLSSVGANATRVAETVGILLGLKYSGT